MPPEKEGRFPEEEQLFPTERLEDYLALSLAAFILLIILLFF
ncbi:MAG: hypothetical protein AB1652_09475 [Bacillota bacterium]